MIILKDEGHIIRLIKWLSENPDQLDDAPRSLPIQGLKRIGIRKAFKIVLKKETRAFRF
jgi:hypothetical protein